MFQFNQGDLDALCGIYSLVNAERLINDSSEEESKRLFNSIIQYLDKQGELASILAVGTIRKHIKLILKEVLADRIPYRELRFDGVKNPDLGKFWEGMTDFLGSGASNVILLGLSGKYEHWTVVKTISDNQMQLFDSDGLHKLNRSGCTTSSEKGSRHHILWPAQTFFLGKAQN